MTYHAPCACICNSSTLRPAAQSRPEHVEVPYYPTLILDGAKHRWRVIDIEADLIDDDGPKMIAYVLPDDPGPPPHAALTVQQAASTAGEMLRIAGAPETLCASVERRDRVREAISWAMTASAGIEPLLSLARLLTLAHDATKP